MPSWTPSLPSWKTKWNQRQIFRVSSARFQTTLEVGWPDATLPHHDNIICWWKLNQAVSLFLHNICLQNPNLCLNVTRKEKGCKTARISWASLRPSPSAAVRKLGLGGASHVWLQCDLTLLHQSTYSLPYIFCWSTYSPPIFSATYFLFIRTLFSHF